MYNYTQAPNLPNSMGGGYFLAYKKLVSSFFSPQKQINNKQPFVSQWGVFYSLLHKSISNPVILSVAFPFTESLAGVNATARTECLRQPYAKPETKNLIHLSNELRNNEAIIQNSKFLIQNCERFARYEPAPLAFRRRISPVQTKGGYQYAD